MPDNLLIKFQKLPDQQKARASDPDTMRTLDSLEKQFGVNLAELVMRVLVHEVDPGRIDETLTSQYGMTSEKGKELGKLMLDDLFFKYRLLEVPDVKESLADIPTPKLMPQPGASPYLVHPDDQKDMAVHIQSLKTAPVSMVDTDPTRTAARLMKMEGLRLDDMLVKRFQRIIEGRLVDVRDRMETRDMLMRSVKIGGMDFDEARADRVGHELDTLVEELHRRPKPVMPKPVTPPSPPAPKPAPVPPPAPARVPTVVPPVGTVAQPKAVATPVAAPVAGIVKPKVAPPPWLRPSNVPAARPAAPQPKPVPPPIPRPRPVPVVQPSYREVVTDVRAPAKVMGPLEVLGSLGIDDFRRLGGTPQACVMKIGEEFDALGQDSFAQRAAGIQAFRTSPTFKGYLDLGQLAMERKEEVREVVELLRAQGKASLTEAEFEAIGSLMRQYRF